MDRDHARYKHARYLWLPSSLLEGFDVKLQNPQTLNPKSEILNPKPQIRNPPEEAVSRRAGG